MNYYFRDAAAHPFQALTPSAALSLVASRGLSGDLLKQATAAIEKGATRKCWIYGPMNQCLILSARALDPSSLRAMRLPERYADHCALYREPLNIRHPSEPVEPSFII
jgi:hypothetical protein